MILVYNFGCDNLVKVHVNNFSGTPGVHPRRRLRRIGQSRVDGRGYLKIANLAGRSLWIAPMKCRADLSLLRELVISELTVNYLQVLIIPRTKESLNAH